MTSPSDPSPRDADDPSLRRLGLSVAAAIVVANMIGSGVFTSAGFQAAGLHDPLAMIATWVVGGVLALCGAAAYGELGARMPRAGGEYVYLREAYHPVVGFMSGWVSLTAGFSAPIAAAALIFSKYVGALVPSLSGEYAQPGVAIGLVAAMTAMHARDAVLGGRVQTVFTLGKVALIGVLILAGLAVGKGSWGNFASRDGGLGNVLTPDFAVSLMYVSFAYSGWNAAAYIAGEIRDPQRTLPRALFLGTGLVMVLYVLLNVVFIYAVPPHVLAGEGGGGPVVEVGHVAAIAMFGDSAGRLISSLVALALVSSVSAMVMAGPRVYAAMAADRALPSVLAVRNARGVPVVAVLTQGVLAVVFVLWGKEIDRLIKYIGFSLALFATLAVASVFVFRARDRHSPAHGAALPYRTWGYPVTPLLFMGMSLWVAYSQARQSWTVSLMVAGTLGLGALVYAVTVAGGDRRGPRAQP
jgi:basic amino acid/polyamine antiporter, APA family